MNQEEILLKVGLDGSGFDQNISRTGTALENFGERAHNSFLHAQKPARAFHHLMGEIGSRVPFLAEAFQGLVNPTTGVIALVGAGFGFAMEKLQEYNKELDEQANKNKESIFGVKEIREVGESIKDIHREVEEFEEKRTRKTAKDLAKTVGQFPIAGMREGISIAMGMALEQEGTEKDLSFQALAQARARLLKRQKELPGMAKAAQALLSGLEMGGEPINFPPLPLDQYQAVLREREEAIQRAKDAVKRFSITEPQEVEDRLKLNAQKAARFKEEILEHDQAVNMLKSGEPVVFHQGAKTRGSGVLESYIKGTHDILQRIEINGIKVPNGP